MKGKLIGVFVLLLLLMGLTQCKSKIEKNLVGVWQLQTLVINGAALKGNSLGNWLWEFNAQGGYLTDIAGMREKGKYTLKDSILTLKIMIPKDGPTQVYRVIKLDSAQLDLFYYENRNKSTLHFVRRKVGDVVGEDKD
jgi:hypothetical protein